MSEICLIINYSIRLAKRILRFKGVSFSMGEGASDTFNTTFNVTHDVKHSTV